MGEFAASSHRLHRLRESRPATVLALALIFGSISVAAEEHDNASAATGDLDFRFEQPRVLLGVRVGYSFNRSDSEIHDFLEQNLTLSHSDFHGPAVAIDAGVRVVSWADVVFGFEFTESREDSEFRDFIEQNGDPIEQETRVTQVPLTLSLKLYPTGRGRQVGRFAWIRSTLVPYLGGGVGGTWYELRQKGDFVDFTDLSIFEATLKSRGWAFSQHAFVGLDIRLTRSLGLVLEGRHHWASGDLGGDFIGFDDIDLDGTRAMIGFSWRL